MTTTTAEAALGSDTAAIRLNNLTRHFDEVKAVDGLTFSVQPGEVFGFLGHNGAGKTTTIRLLNGVLEPTGGSAQVFGLDPTTHGAEIRRKTGVLTETHSADERLTARENLTIYAELYDVPESQVKVRVPALLERFGLAGRADEKVGGYSKGMRQRLALARALLHAPVMLFLDEPTAGLDPVAAKEVRELIHHLSREEGRTVFLATHNLPEAQRLCDRLAVLEQGKLLAIGTLSEINQRLGHRSRVVVEVTNPTHTRALLDGMPGLTYEATEDGRQLVVTGVAQHDIPELVSALAGQGARIMRVAPQEASLEEIYFALHEQAQAHAHEGGIA